MKLDPTYTPWYKEEPSDPPTPPTPPAPKTFLQEDVEKIVQQRLAGQKRREQELLAKLSQLETKGLSSADREILEGQIQELQTQNLSKEEQFKIQQEKIAKDHKKELTKLTEENQKWQNLFTNTSIRQEITAAASANNAESVDQMLMMFSGSTRLEEEQENNKPTGRYKAMMKFVGIDPDTKSKREFDLPVSEAVEKLRNDGLNPNLFKHTSAGGTGQTSSGSSGKSPNSMPLPGDYTSSAAYQAAYSAWRQKFNLDGTERK